MFDCDGVLADSEVISAEILVAALVLLGVAIDPPHIFRHYVGQSFPKVAARIMADFRVELPEDFETRYRRRLLEAFQSRLEPTEGVVAAIEGIATPVCVATSSSPPRVARTLALCGLADRFGPAVFTASEVARGKPAPDLFLHVADRMAVAPARCLVVEDSLAGIAAAQAAGMSVLRYVGGSHLRDVPPAALGTPAGVSVFADWRDFAGLVPHAAPAGA